ncbi:MAG TPA: hypothetical protein VME42_03725 [Steroidobacteraceae bacterium]|nr:hypothetical protein [Steroidobacteraceae bacterium]
MKTLLALAALLAAAGAAQAQDEFYSIEPGDAAAQIGTITATGFIETDGFGTSAWNLVDWMQVVGYDITITNGTVSANFCFNGAGNAGCTANDAPAALQQGLLATTTGLYCSGCLFYDVGVGPVNWFQFSSANGNVYELDTGYEPQNHYDGEDAGTSTASGVYAIAGGSPTTYDPLQAPELDLGRAVAAVTLLAGLVLVLKSSSGAHS